MFCQDGSQPYSFVTELPADSHLRVTRKVAREVWKASDPRFLDPFEWTLAESPRLVGLWWVSFVGYAILELMALSMGYSSGLALRRLQLALAIEMLANIAGAVSSALAFLVVIRISRSQDEKWARMQRQRADEA